MLECDLSRFSTDGNRGRVVWIVVFTKKRPEGFRRPATLRVWEPGRENSKITRRISGGGFGKRSNGTTSVRACFWRRSSFFRVTDDPFILPRELALQNPRHIKGAKSVEVVLLGRYKAKYFLFAPETASWLPTTVK
jgi:hypothetical protein